jgi:predicted DCC family thiol-disulfide oxidoreductase YuxK
LKPENKKIILFDGVCNLCSSSVNFVIKRDKRDVFRFAALQEDIGKELVAVHNIDPVKTDSIVFIEHGKAYVKSTAALRASKYLPGAWPLLYGFVIVPRFIRNCVYDIIARNRYKWYGKQESCMIPTPELRSKFL